MSREGDTTGGQGARKPAAKTPWTVRSLKSRYRAPGVLELWGRTDAPDGSTVKLRLAGGTTARTVVAPAAQGRFYVREALPASLHGKRLRITGRIAG